MVGFWKDRALAAEARVLKLESLLRSYLVLDSVTGGSSVKSSPKKSRVASS